QLEQSAGESCEIFFINPPVCALTTVVVRATATITSVITIVTDVIIMGTDKATLSTNADIYIADRRVESSSKIVIALGTLGTVAEL
ncbi:hypothetical protein GWI33_010913, partial [Rhynchophorus ferrugineus]